MGEEASVDGHFQIYSFASRATRVWQPDRANGGIDQVLLLDETKLIVVEIREDLQKTLALIDAVTGARTVVARAEGNANAFSQLRAGAGRIVWVDTNGATQFHALSPDLGPSEWRAPSGRYAEYQRPALSPSGATLARIHFLPVAPGVESETQLELVARGQEGVRVISRGVSAFAWENETSILMAVRSQTQEGRRSRPRLEVSRVDIASGSSSNVASMDLSIGAVVFAD